MAAIMDAMQPYAVDGLVERLWYFQSVLINSGSVSSCIDGSLQMAGPSSPAAEGAAPDVAQNFCSQQLVMGRNGGGHDDQRQQQQQQLVQQPEVVQQMRSYMTRVDQLYQSDLADLDCSCGPADTVRYHESICTADGPQHLRPLISVSPAGAAGGGVVSVDDQRLQRLRAVRYEDLIRADASPPSSSSSSHDCDNLDLENDDDEQDELLAQAFNVYDKNRDGFISASELAYVLTGLGLLSCTTHDDDDVQGLCRTLIQRVDRDGNGLVDLHEFKAMIMCA